ncbi:MAG: hypothetical protein ACP5OA_00415 [Candidatus Woesearchaeota archaeon]
MIETGTETKRGNINDADRDNEELSKLVKFINPRYRELELALLSFSFIILCLINLNWLLHDFKYGIQNYGYYIYLLIGAVISIYHIFIRRKKKRFEKFIMIHFAIYACALGGIFSGIYIIEHHSLSPLLIFPLINIAQGYILLLSLSDGSESSDYYNISIRNIDSRNDNPKYLIISLPIILLIILLGQYVLKLHPIVMFSILITYSVVISNFLRELKLYTEPKIKKKRYI